MSQVIVIGSQWGDEGKGKIVDWLSERAEVIVRFQGGHNAGHTLVIGGVTYKLSLLPSGVVRKGKFSVIGNGVVIDPHALLKEIAAIREKGVEITPQNLMIAENAALILPLHQQIDQLSEAAKGDSKIGTTGRGIGPAYEDKVGRRAIRVCDLADEALLKERLKGLVTHHNALRRGYNVEEVDGEAIFAELMALAPQILPFAKPVWYELQKLQQAGKHILFEGAQGILLDVDHGTYPFVTSSNTVAGSAYIGSGIGLSNPSMVLGITKAYTTRVGSGPFPTELTDEIGELLGRRGHEFGTVTARKRRCGWFDAVLVRQTITLSGITGIALTKLDVMDTLEEVKICTGYELDGQKLDYLPASPTQQARVKPLYETLPGWQSPTEGMRELSKLPKQARAYITRIEELTGCKIASISTSPEREDTILVRNPFETYSL